MASNSNLDFKMEVDTKAPTVNLVDELEDAFQNCIHALTKEESGFGDESVKHEQTVEQTTSKFIDLARQIEVFFLQKRFLVLNMNPELMLKEENNDLRSEIQRKDELLKKHFEKIDAWKQLLQDQPTRAAMPPDVRGGGVGVGGMPPMMPQPPQPNQMMMAQQPMMPHMGPGGPQPPPNPQMFMQQNPRMNFNQGPLDYLLKTTNNIDSVGLGDGRR